MSWAYVHEGRTEITQFLHSTAVDCQAPLAKLQIKLEARNHKVVQPLSCFTFTRLASRLPCIDDTVMSPNYRVADCRDELTGINNRILTAQAKIDKLRSSSTKATQVFSSPKYPAPDKIRDYRTIYEDFNPALHKVCISLTLGGSAFC